MEDITVLLSGGKSPSKEAMKRTFSRSTLNGGVTQDFTANVENIRDVSRDLGYNILQDASFVYVPSSYGESKNFVQNPSIRNLVKYSEEIDNSFWVKNNATVSANLTTSPDGNTTADKLIENTANDVHLVNFPILPMTTGKTYTLSAYLKADTRTWGLLYIYDDINGSKSVYFDLQNGVLGSVASGATASIVSAGSGWYRCSMTLTILNSNNNGGIGIAQSNNTGSYLGNGTSGLYIWGAQLEQSPTVTPYQRTTDGIADFTFTRATTSTATNKLGVIEDSCYNLLQYSEDFDNSIWNKRSGITITPNTTIAPNGTLTADTATWSSGDGYIWENFTFAKPSTTYTISVYAKQISGSVSLKFHWDDGSFGSSSPLYVLTTEWQRYSFTFTTTSTAGAFGDLGFFVINGNAAIWGAQVEQGSTPRPYLKTTNRLNVPKLDYSRSLLEPSLLIERQSTNICLQSENIDTGVWGKNNLTSPLSSVLSPSNTLTVCKLTENNANSLHTVSQSRTGSNETVTFSVYAKAAERNWLALNMSNGSNADVTAWFNISTGSTGSIVYFPGGTDYTGATTSIINAGNGFYRCMLTVTKGTVNTTNGFAILTSTGDAVSSYTGTTGNGLYVWGAQLEQGSKATTYIPTTTATVTRNRESNEVDLFNNNVLNKDNFTLYAEGYLYDYTNTNATIMLGGQFGLAANSIGFFDGFRGIARDADNINQIVGTSLSRDSAFKVVIQRNGTSIKYFRNGVLLGSQTISVYDYRYLSINDGQGSTFTIDKILLFNRTLSDSECLDLTD